LETLTNIAASPLMRLTTQYAGEVRSGAPDVRSTLLNFN